jgi:hypothetical protein
VSVARLWETPRVIVILIIIPHITRNRPPRSEHCAVVISFIIFDACFIAPAASPLSRHLIRCVNVIIMDIRSTASSPSHPPVIAVLHPLVIKPASTVIIVISIIMFVACFIAPAASPLSRQLNRLVNGIIMDIRSTASFPFHSPVIAVLHPLQIRLASIIIVVIWTIAPGDSPPSWCAVGSLTITSLAAIWSLFIIADLTNSLRCSSCGPIVPVRS